jgi:hypothetical protein
MSRFWVPEFRHGNKRESIQTNEIGRRERRRVSHLLVYLAKLPFQLCDLFSRCPLERFVGKSTQIRSNFTIHSERIKHLELDQTSERAKG